MKKYSFVYSLTGLTSLQIGIKGELLKTLKKEGKNLKVIKCNAVLQNCYFNKVHNCLGCVSCQTRTDTILNNLIDQKDIINLEPKVVNIKLPLFKNQQELIDYTYRDINIGRGVASSVISYFRDFELTKPRYKDIIQLELEKAALVVENIFSWLDLYEIEEFYVFNGRFAEIHPLIQVCKKKSIPFFTVESGSKLKYQLFANSLPHSISERNRQMTELWDNEDEVETKHKVANDWYLSKRSGDTTYEKSFVQKEERNASSAYIDSAKINILILNSSEDELKVIQEWEHSYYNSQNEVIQKLADLAIKNQNWNLILRIHPNLGLIKNQQTAELLNLKSDRLKVIKPFEKVDTYKLIDSCDKVLVFGSTTGIEATYYGKPAILFGNSFYKLLNATYNPTSYEELELLLSKEDLEPKPKENTLKYGYYFATFGEQFQYFKLNGKHKSTFDGRKIKSFSISSFRYLGSYFFEINKWRKAFKAIFDKKLSFKDLFTYK